MGEKNSSHLKLSCFICSMFSTVPLSWAEICFVFMMRKLGILVGHRDYCHNATLDTVHKEFHRV